MMVACADWLGLTRVVGRMRFRKSMSVVSKRFSLTERVMPPPLRAG